MFTGQFEWECEALIGPLGGRGEVLVGIIVGDNVIPALRRPHSPREREDPRLIVPDVVPVG